MPWRKVSSQRVRVKLEHFTIRFVHSNPRRQCNILTWLLLLDVYVR